MARQHYILLAVLIVFLLPSSAYPEIIQHFDSKGDPVSINQTKSSYDARSLVRRYSLPEGIVLRKDIKYEFYPVFGKTFSEIVRSTEENGPLNIKDNRRYRSRFEWKFGWSYKFNYSEELGGDDPYDKELDEEDLYDQELDEEDLYDQGPDEKNKLVHISLDIYDINISYDIKITLPTLIDDSALNPIEKSMWKNYLQKLIDYEYDHVKIIEDPATKDAIIKSIKDINYLILDHKEGVDNEKIAESFLIKETSNLGRYWASQIKIRYDEYDKATNFGMKPEMREAFFKQKP